MRAGYNEHFWLVQPDLSPEEEQVLPFLRSLPLWAEADDYLFVHAGVRPGVPMAQQAARDLLEIRQEFHAHPNPHAKTVVFGHTAAHDLGGEPGRVWVRPGKIGIDTGAGHGITLSLVDLSQRLVHAVPVQASHPVTTTPLL